MALITCPECEKQISEHALSCPNCGFQLSQETVSKQKEEPEKHGFHDYFKDSSPLETESKQKEEQQENELNDPISFTNLLKRAIKREERLSGEDKSRLVGLSFVFALIILIVVSVIIKQIDVSKSSHEDSYDKSKSSTIIPPNPSLIKVDYAVERENRRKKVDSINRESNRIAQIAIGDMPKRSINVDSLMLVFRKFTADSAELGLIYAKYLIELKNQLIMEKEHIKWDPTLSTISRYNENIEVETKHRSASSNEYAVKEDIWAAKSKASFDKMTNCLISGDKQALQSMINNGQLINLHRNDVVFLEEAKFTYSIVRQEGSTESLYVPNDVLQKQ